MYIILTKLLNKYFRKITWRVKTFEYTKCVRDFEFLAEMTPRKRPQEYIIITTHHVQQQRLVEKKFFILLEDEVFVRGSAT